MRPTTASSPASRGAPTPGTGGAVARFRPQSAAVDAAGGASPFKAPPSSDKANASSDELIRDLEAKVREVVEQKRAESDKLRFAVAKKRDEVEKAKLILQDLLKDSGALGLQYDLSTDGADGPQQQHSHQTERKTNQQDVGEGDGHTEKKKGEDDAERLQPIVSISRRPVYSKHTNIHELEAKIERRAKEAHLVQRRTLVLEHIKKRLENERFEVAQRTNQLKQAFADLSHETQELQKRDIAAAEAVSQEQARLVQQKADMAASVRKFKRELALRHKWAREKAKFETYYNDQLQAATLKAAHARGHAGDHHDHGAGHYAPHATAHGASTASATAAPSSVPRRTLGSPPGVLKHRRSSNLQAMQEKAHEDGVELRYRAAFQRIGVDPRVEAIDPEEIIHICLSHEELRKELDAKHDEAVERVAQLREQICKARSLAREDVPLSKRGTSQKIESKQLEISSVERQLATVVDQYMFVESTVRPIKIGLQQVLQNVSSATVNVDNMAALEKCLVDSCEEMMRLLRGSSSPETAEPAEPTSAGISGPIPEGEAFEHDDHDSADNNRNNKDTTDHDSSPQRASRAPPIKEAAQPVPSSAKHSEPPVVVSLESFTSPYNVRIAPKKRDSYFVPGLTKASSAAKAAEEDDVEETDFDVMDRAMVKRISSVVVCTSAGKKPKVKASLGDTSRFGTQDLHHAHGHTH